MFVTAQNIRKRLLLLRASYYFKNERIRIRLEEDERLNKEKLENFEWDFLEELTSEEYVRE